MPHPKPDAALRDGTEPTPWRQRNTRWARGHIDRKLAAGEPTTWHDHLAVAYRQISEAPAGSHDLDTALRALTTLLKGWSNDLDRRRELARTAPEPRRTDPYEEL